MFPTIHLASVEISSYWLFFSTGLIVSTMLAFHHLLQSGYQPERVINGVLLTIIGSFAGAILLNNLITPLYRLFTTGYLHIEGGITIVGGLMGGMATGYWYCRRHNIAPGRPFDIVLLYGPLGQAIGRVGCLANGCCYGRENPGGWLALYAPDSQGYWAMRYPTQLMSSLANLLIFLILAAYFYYQVRVRGKEHPGPFPGFVALLYVCLYAVKRFFIEFLRGDTWFIPSLSLSVVQLIMLASFLIAVGLIFFLFRKYGRGSFSNNDSGPPAYSLGQ